MKKVENRIFVVLILIIIALIGLIAFQRTYVSKKYQKQVLTEEKEIINVGLDYVPTDLNKVIYLNYRYNIDNPINKEVFSKIQMNILLKILKNGDLKKIEEKVEKNEQNKLVIKITLKGNTESVLTVYMNSDNKYLNIKYDDNDENYIISDDLYTNLLKVFDKKYFLHMGNKDIVSQLPTEDEINVSREKVFNGMSSVEQEKLKDNIYILHQYISVALDGGHDVLKDPNSIWWNVYLSNDQIEDKFTGEKIDGTNELNGVSNRMNEIVNEIKDEEAKEKFEDVYNILKIGLANHDLDLCYKFHEYIHDYDYWVINFDKTKEKQGCNERAVFFGKMI